MQEAPYGSKLPGRQFSAYLCLCFVGENSTPVCIIWVQIKFRKIGWIDNYLCTIEKKFQIFLKNMKIWINFSNFQIFRNLKNLFKFSNLSEKFDFFFQWCTSNYLSNLFFGTLFGPKLWRQEYCFHRQNTDRIRSKFPSWGDWPIWLTCPRRTIPL